MLIMKDGKVGPARVKVSSSQTYTVTELEALARDWHLTTGGDDDLEHSTLGWFLEWLSEREREHPQ